MTALGIDNLGTLNLSYGIEDIDYQIIDGSTSYAFNAAENVFWRRIRILMYPQLKALYRSLASGNCWSSTHLINEYDRWQEQFPEELWRLDIERKYIRTFRGEGLDQGRTPSPTTKYVLEMMNGRKKYQRRQFERDQEAYIGTKYLIPTYENGDRIEFRFANPNDTPAGFSPDWTLYIVPYSDMYLSVIYGNAFDRPKQIRAKAGVQYEFEYHSLGNMTQTQTVICCASRIQELSDLSRCYVQSGDFSTCTKLRKLKIGDSNSNYRNTSYTNFTLLNAPIMDELDVSNCVSLTGDLRLSGFPNLSKLYAKGSKIGSVEFADYGKITTALLPPTASTLIMRNLYYLTTLDASLGTLTQLTIAYCDSSAINDYNIVSASADTLTYLRLEGINWSTDNVSFLNKLVAIDSNLTGTLTITDTVGGQELLSYRNKWKDLQINATGTIIPQVLCTYYSDDTENKTALCSVWISSGDTPPDVNELISMGKLSGTPTKATDERYVYTFRDWKIGGYTSEGLAPVYGNSETNTEIYAMYDTDFRTYTVRWCAKTPTGYGDTFFLVKSDVHYGDEVTYDLPDIPEDHSLDSRGIYRVFAGWDKCTGNITENTDVVAIWEQGSPPNTKQYKGTMDLLSQMTVGEINAVVQTNQVDDYFDPADTVDIVLGHDFNFSNVESDVLIGEGSILNLNDKVWFDGNTAYDTGIRLLDENAPSFTLAVEYRVIAPANESSTVFSCYKEEGAEGFYVYRAAGSNNADAPLSGIGATNAASVLAWGDQSVRFGDTRLKDIVVLRHKQGSPVLNVYANNGVPDYAARIYTDEMFFSGVTRARETSTDNTLVLGARKNQANNSSYIDYLKGIIYWCKIWYDDIGDANARQLAAWPHELLRMNFIDKGRYELADNSGNTTSMSFIANNLLAERSARYAMHEGNGNAASLPNTKRAYPYCLIRQFLNTRLWNAMPIVWRSLIKQVKLPCAAPGNEQNLIYCNDNLYLPAAVEIHRNGVSDHMLADEGKSISFFYTTPQDRPSFRIKHPVPDVENAVMYTDSDDPKWNHEVHDSDWWATSYSSTAGWTQAGKYKTDEWRMEHPVYAEVYTTAHDGGIWVGNSTYWTRSHSNITAGSSVVLTSGVSNQLSPNSASSGSGSWGNVAYTHVCPCFSI